MDEEMTLSLEEQLIADLTAELEVADEKFNPSILASKVKTALSDVAFARKYPDYYSEEQINRDMNKHYAKIRAIALNDYNKVGIDFENSHSENSVSASFVDRNKLFAGIIPLSR